MKNLVYTIMILCFSQMLSAQITLEHTFDGSITFPNYIINYDLDVDLYIPNTASDVNNIKLYNTDYSLYKNISITPPVGYKVSSVSLYSKNIFNNDDKIEFMVTFQSNASISDYANNIEAFYNNISILKLYNEDGTVLKDFGSGYVLSPSIHKVNNQYRLSILHFHFHYHYPSSGITYTTEIYSLPGSMSAGVSQARSAKAQLPYPNPANEVIMLPYELEQGESALRIFDMRGNLIEQKRIDAYFDKIMLNVSNYPQGMYLYEVNGVKNKFIVE